MFDRDEIHQRGKALEDEFFYHVDQQLGAELRAKLDREEALQRLKSATGFSDPSILEHLVDAGLTASSITALALVPLVFVAWADGSVDSAERQAIMSDALHRHIQEPDARSLIETWLKKSPGDELWSLWAEYSSDLLRSLPSEQRKTLRDQIVRSSTIVAEASGGHFGIGKVSAQEKAVLDRIGEQLSKVI